MGTKRTRTDRSWLGRAALAAGVAVAAAACAPRYLANAPPIADDRYKDGGKPNPNDPYLFTIAEDPSNGCPSSVTMDPAYQNCPDASKDCVRVKQGQTVRFQSPSNDFFLRFDPFDPKMHDAGGKPLDLVAPKHASPGKPYSFSVGRSKPACADKGVDPQIILD
jgi:hypothetical protein